MSRAYRHAPVVAALAERIRTGVYAPGAQLPSLASIQTEFDVGGYTARAAVRDLEGMGLVEARKGHGTYVRSDLSRPEYRPRRRPHATRRHAPADAPTAGDDDLTVTASTTTTGSAPQDVAAHLDIPDDATVHMTRVVLSDEHGPVAVRTTYSPTAEPGAASVYMTATHAALPDPQDAADLGISVTMPTLVHQEVATLRGRPVQLTRTVARGDAVQLTDAYRVTASGAG
jgi:DNA-binding GntR family transcriptional regulator